MSVITCTREIKAPIGRVFKMIADPETFSERVPHITDIKFLTEQRTGKGTRFIETRMMKNRKSSTTLEITEYNPPDRVRFVADQGGAVWDTVFSLKELASGTRLTMVMEARPHKFLAKIFTPIIKGMIGKAVESDMDATKAYLEGKS